MLCSTLYYPNIGGVENSLFHLSRAYQETGARPWLLVSTGGDPQATGEAVEVGRIKGVPVIRYRFSRTALVRLFRVAMALRALFRRGKWEATVVRDQHSALAPK